MSRRRRRDRTVTLAGGPFAGQVIQVPNDVHSWATFDPTTGVYATYTGDGSGGLTTFTYAGPPPRGDLFVAPLGTGAPTASLDGYIRLGGIK
jgi:hypothetical protein